MDASAYATLLVGFALGLRHATDADHVVAVTTLVSGTAGVPTLRRGLQVGALWGLGHLLTLFAAGGVLVVLRVKVPQRVEWALELVVALVLVWLGVHTIWKCFTGRYHFHVHQHGPHAHAHLHFHAAGAEHEHDAHAGASRAMAGSAARSPRRAPLLVGMAHGLAGTAGLALLVLTSITSRPLGVLYLLVFGLGALTGMAAFSALLGVPLGRVSQRAWAQGENISRLNWLAAMRFAAGAASGILGAVLTHRAFLSKSWPF